MLKKGDRLNAMGADDEEFAAGDQRGGQFWLDARAVPSPGENRERPLCVARAEVLAHVAPVGEAGA